ncbi:hypothetical protein J8L98_13375 [Pseudoalteromonas sp. MMG013]|uniref:hypothetical protein n=1 Tax=Pseudoalteromonas sp. MMG013 TaxID=2822687 RepID=UPI001B382194|nr:hypothetical protein [Pseudoalteromonas sp. MMG013]MBQ4862681.1 hypothetical protein [Pseudoalteromonas sp. MMG013]
MNELKAKKIEKDVFRIMRHKIKGSNNQVELTCWRMVSIAKAINQRFSVMPYQIRLKHLVWYIDEILFWKPSVHTCYRHYLTIKSFAVCIDKWGHWQNSLERIKPSLERA